MKKQILIIGLMVLLLAMPFAIADASLKASLLRYDPLPAAPGQFVSVYVKLENVGNEDATAVALRIQDQFPFSIVREDERTEYIGELQSQQSVVKEFRIRVDSEAFIGENQFTVNFANNYNSDEWQESSFNIDVESDEASLAITKVEASEITPGGEGTLTVTVKNNEETVLRNIALQLHMIATMGTTSIDLPFIPLNSATEKRISRLNPGEITSVSYGIQAYPSATPGYYKLPLSISYVSDQGIETENMDYTGIIIKAVPELKILLEETTVTKEGLEGEITFKFINKGINDLKFLDIEVVEKEGYIITSNYQDYIGDLDSDDYRSESYNVKVTDENIEYDIKVSYKDENNKEYNNIITVPIRFSEQPEQKNNTGTIAIIAIVIIGGFVYYKYKRKKKR